MYRPILLLIALFSSTLVSANYNDHACPSGSTLMPIKDQKTHRNQQTNYECKCVGYGYKTKPFNDGCSASLYWSGRYPQCFPYCPPKKPEPSHRPWKKRTIQVPVLPDGSPSHCQNDDIACPILGTGLENEQSGGKVEYECAKPLVDIDNCGGCAATGEGQNCAEIAGVRGASCVEGKCQIHSCSRGFVLRSDLDNKQFCKKTFLAV